jgi:hypothetical protein
MDSRELRLAALRVVFAFGDCAGRGPNNSVIVEPEEWPKLFRLIELLEAEAIDGASPAELQKMIKEAA